MADGLNIPGVSDRYKTKDLVESLMEVERLPLKREESNIETYKKQQDAWRGVNQRMSTLRESSKALYSFENPFNNKLTSSSEEYAVTIDAGRDAAYGSFKLEVDRPATADRFLSEDIDKDTKVPQGKYTFTVGEKTVEFNWKGGKIADFVTALNKRSNGTVKASLIGVSADKKSLLLESLKTGIDNKLIFENKAFDFAREIGMIGEAKSDESYYFSNSMDDLKFTATKDIEIQENLIDITKKNVSVQDEEFIINPRGGFEIDIPKEALSNNSKVEFDFNVKYTKDITSQEVQEQEEKADAPVLPEPQSIEYGGVTVFNNSSETTLPPAGEKVAAVEEVPLKPVEISDQDIFYITDSRGKEKKLNDDSFTYNQDGTAKVSFSLKDYPDAKRLIVRNANTGKIIRMQVPQAFDVSKQGIQPLHPISQAEDAQIRYEGITMNRPENDIDDVVPHVTLHIHEKTEKAATLKIEPDTESAKDAIITFVGKYNQILAEMTILSTNKPEVVAELDYLSKEEKEEAMERLGMFQGDFTLTNGKASLQRITSANYRFSDSAEITMLSQLGISTNASGGTQGYNASQMRGYLEVDEKKLDKVLGEHLDQVKMIFGYDSDGDLIIDDGIALKLDKQLTSWVQSGGIISSRTNSLDTQIKNSESKITRLQTQLDRKEMELRRKYAQMEGTLNSLESQSNSINNFATQNSNNRR